MEKWNLRRFLNSKKSKTQQGRLSEESSRGPENRFFGRQSAKQSSAARETVRENALVFLVTLAALALLSYLFYDSALFGAALSIPAFFPARKLYRRSKEEKRVHRLKKQFLLGVSLLGDYLKTGYSVENALGCSGSDLAVYEGEESEIVHEWETMTREIRMNRTAEEAFYGFGIRSGIREIRDFSEIFGVVKRTGGNLSLVVRETSDLLSEQFLVEEEIRTSTAAKRMEQKIMDVMPAGILLYMKFTSPELLSPLYTSIAGRILMSVCLVLYIVAVLWAEKIANIKM